MRKIKKIFSAGSVMSGKNILWRLLDGHSEIISNVMHSSLGYFVLSGNCKDLFLKNLPGIGKNTLPFVPVCTIVYRTGEVATVQIGDFFYALYNFTGYRVLHTWAKGQSTFVNMKEGETARYSFVFDVRNFEDRIEDRLFVEGTLFTEDEVLDVIYSSYLDSIGDKIFREQSSKTFRYFADTLPNGANPIRTVAESIPDAKILIMKRDLIPLVFANTVRMQSYNSDFSINTTFRKILFNQKRFETKIKTFHNDIGRLQELYKNIMLVDFDQLILDTENTMRTIAKFIDVEYEDILAQPSVNGEVIDPETYLITGKINDDPYEYLTKTDVALLNNLLYGYDKNSSILTNALIFLQKLKWCKTTKLVAVLYYFLEFLLPKRLVEKLKGIYRTT